jgi:hypothetical protein
VLRFFAFRQRANIKGSVRSMLDRCMENQLTIGETDVAELVQVFQSRLQLARSIFREHVFQYKDEEGKWQLSHPLYDGIMVALDRLWEKRKRLISARVEILRAISDLLSNPAAFEVIVGRPNTAKAVVKRLDLLAKAIEDAAK